MKLMVPRGSHGLVQRQQHYPAPAPIEAYGNGGFRFAGMSHRGSILVLPSGVHGWAATSTADLTVAGLQPALAEAGGFEVLLIGSGRDIAPLPDALRHALGDIGLRADVMPTGAAARTFNIMLGENRKVAAALLAVE